MVQMGANFDFKRLTAFCAFDGTKIEVRHQRLPPKGRSRTLCGVGKVEVYHSGLPTDVRITPNRLQFQAIPESGLIKIKYCSNGSDADPRYLCEEWLLRVERAPTELD